MPLLGQAIAALFTALSGFLLKLFVARVAIRVTAVAAIASLGTALMVSFNSFVAPIVGGLFATQYGQLLGLVFPPFAGTVLFGLVALWSACAVYKLQVSAIKVTANI